MGEISRKTARIRQAREGRRRRSRTAELWAIYVGAATGLVGAFGGIYGVYVAKGAFDAGEEREKTRARIEENRLNDERFKTRLPEKHEEATKRVRKFLLYGDPGAPEVPLPKNANRGFIGFPRLLFAAVAKGRHRPEFATSLWHDLNAEASFRDIEIPEYSNYGSEYTGFGPYMVTRGRGRFESMAEEDVLKAAEGGYPVSAGVPIYYKLGYEVDFASESERRSSNFGKVRNTFSMIRLRIDILKPLEFDGHITTLQQMIKDGIKDEETLSRFQAICEQSGVIVGAFKWAWIYDFDGWQPGLTIDAKNLPARSLAIRDEINAFIYGDQPNPFQMRPPLVSGQ